MSSWPGHLKGIWSALVQKLVVTGQTREGRTKLLQACNMLNEGEGFLVSFAYCTLFEAVNTIVLKHPEMYEIKNSPKLTRIS